MTGTKYTSSYKAGFLFNAGLNRTQISYRAVSVIYKHILMDSGKESQDIFPADLYVNVVEKLSCNTGQSVCLLIS
jgi:hypothetical protein